MYLIEEVKILNIHCLKKKIEIYIDKHNDK